VTFRFELHKTSKLWRVDGSQRCSKEASGGHKPRGAALGVRQGNWNENVEDLFWDHLFRPFFGDHSFRPENQERKRVKTILSAKIIKPFVGGDAIILSVPRAQGTLATLQSAISHPHKSWWVGWESVFFRESAFRVSLDNFLS